MMITRPYLVRRRKKKTVKEVKMTDFEMVLDFEDGDLEQEEDHNWWVWCDCGDCDDCDDHYYWPLP